MRVFTAWPRRFQRAPSRNPGPRNGGRGAKSGELRPSFDTADANQRINWQFRDGNRWKRGYVTLWLAGATARLTVYESKETFHRLTDNIVRSWVADPKGSTLELLHASASVSRTLIAAIRPAFPKDSSDTSNLAGRRSTTG